MCLLQVPPENTLISPVQCKSIWRTFTAETEYVVTQAISARVQHYLCVSVLFIKGLIVFMESSFKNGFTINEKITRMISSEINMCGSVFLNLI